MRSPYVSSLPDASSLSNSETTCQYGTAASFTILVITAASACPIEAGLRTTPYHVSRTSTVATAWTLLESQAIDCIILSLPLPDSDGVTLCQRLRRVTPLPVLVIAPAAAEDEIIAILDAGAQDCLSRHFTIPELLAKIRVYERTCLSLEPSRSSSNTALTGLVINPSCRQVWYAQQRIALTPTE